MALFNNVRKTVRSVWFNNRVTDAADKGYSLIVVLIAILITSACIGAIYGIFKNDIKDATPNFWTPVAEALTLNSPDNHLARPFKDFFPHPPAPQSQDMPPEPSISPDNHGNAISTSAIATGEWHGRYTAKTPPMFAGRGGGWEAVLHEDSTGVITGSFKSDFGINGSVNGKRTGATASWSIGGGDTGLRFTGKISGNTVEGTFSGQIYEGQNASGDFFGGRIVQ